MATTSSAAVVGEELMDGRSLDGQLVPYRAGQKVICKVVSKLERTPEGYFVTMLKTGEHGFLQTTADLSVDDEILGQFVCWAGGRSYMLLSHIAGKSK